MKGLRYVRKWRLSGSSRYRLIRWTTLSCASLVTVCSSCSDTARVASSRLHFIKSMHRTTSATRGSWTNEWSLAPKLDDSCCSNRENWRPNSPWTKVTARRKGPNCFLCLWNYRHLWGWYFTYRFVKFSGAWIVTFLAMILFQYYIIFSKCLAMSSAVIISTTEGMFCLCVSVCPWNNSKSCWRILSETFLRGGMCD